MAKEPSEALKAFKNLAEIVDRCICCPGLDHQAVEVRLKELKAMMPIEEQLELGQARLIIGNVIYTRSGDYFRGLPGRRY